MVHISQMCIHLTTMIDCFSLSARLAAERERAAIADTCKVVVKAGEGEREREEGEGESESGGQVKG